MILREEIFEQTDGLGVLELRGGELELALFVNGEPLAYDAADCAGSVGRFTVLLPDSSTVLDTQAVELNAQRGFQGRELLSKQIAPLLKLLPDGYYHLALTETTGCWLVDWDTFGNESHLPSTWYYPLGDIMSVPNGSYPHSLIASFKMNA
ncbi:hypothetical protein IAD21_02247 [Abditibacteriota bacterium]|nr:hypothetical protein IAD21_02247 [Abditibacteriota bacterium]